MIIIEKKPTGDIQIKLNENKKPVGIHKQVIEFNKKILEDEHWGEANINKNVNREEEVTPLAYAKKKNPLNQLFSARDPRERNPLGRGAQSVNSSMANSVANSRPSTSHTRKQGYSPNASLLHQKLLEAKEMESRANSAKKRNNLQSLLKMADPSTTHLPVTPSNIKAFTTRGKTSEKAFRSNPGSRQNSVVELPKVEIIEKRGKF